MKGNSIIKSQSEFNLFRKAFLRVSTSVKSDAEGKSTNQMNAQLKTEQRVTLTVCLIVTSFIITQVKHDF